MESELLRTAGEIESNFVDQKTRYDFITKYGKVVE